MTNGKLLLNCLIVEVQLPDSLLQLSPTRQSTVNLYQFPKSLLQMQLQLELMANG
jgi:hypothetical protein